MFDNVHDTLLGHHTFASHFPQRLDHVVSEYCDAAPWKVVFGRRGKEEKGLAPVDMPGEELTRYNAADCRLTIAAWHRMQADLEPERAVYEHDRQLARVCHEMSYVGLGVDVARQTELSEAMRRRRAALKGKMRAILKAPSFNPGQLDSVRRALFRSLRGQYISLTTTGLPSTNNATLEALQGSDTRLARFARALLQWRLVGKVRSTYVDSVRVNPSTGRTHYNWKPFGTVSGRLSCRLQSCPRYAPAAPEGRVREIYVPRKGNVFVYFDVSQAEMRIAAYLSADKNFMAACGSDVHAGNAAVVFPEIAAKGWLEGDAKKDPARGKPYRDIAKNLGFAIIYRAESEKVFTFLRSQGFAVSYAAVERIMSRLRTAYVTYYRFADVNTETVKRCGYMRTPILGRIRWLGWYPSPTDVANYPIQSCLADVMNARMIELFGRLPPGCSIVAQIHDALIVDVPVRAAGEVERLIQGLWAAPITLAGGALILPIDSKRGDRWGELG